MTFEPGFWAWLIRSIKPYDGYIMFKKFLLPFFIFFYTSFALFSMDEPITDYYLRHITSILPAPIMLVGGISSTYRPTLHWSLLGTKPPMVHEHISKEGTTKTPFTLEDDKEYKYGIIESLRYLAPKVVGGEYFDIFTFGSHEPSTEAYLFVPENEIINKSIYNATIVHYDSEASTVCEAIDRFADQRHIKYVKFATPALLANQPLEYLHKRVQFINDILKVDPTLAFESILDATDIAMIENSGNCFKRCLSTKACLEGESCDLAIIAAFIGDQKYLLLWINNSHEDNSLKLMRYFWHNSNALVNFDTAIFAQEVDSLRNIFKRYDIPLDWCNIGHPESKLPSLEKGVLKIPIYFRTKWKAYLKDKSSIHDIFNIIKIEMNNEYKNKLEKHKIKFPAAFAEKLVTFFEEAHKEMLENYILQVFAAAQRIKQESQKIDLADS